MKKRSIFMMVLAGMSSLMISCSKNKETLDPKAGIQSSQSLSSNAKISTPMSIYGAWHAGNDGCSWATVRNMTDFDKANHWIIDRGDGNPSVNLVILSFVNPLRLLNQTTDAATLNGIPRGMTQDVVDYFKSRNIRIILSIGGITYVNDWNTALNTNPRQLGLNAAAVAQQMGVGIEIDYEESSTPNLAALQTFIDTYRSVLPYDASGTNHASRLTIDLAAGDRWLVDICRKATTDWLRTDVPVLDYANAMVQSKPSTLADDTTSWSEHIVGKSTFSPKIPPLAPCKLTAGIYIAYGNKALSECVDFNSSTIKTTGDYVQSVSPKGAGTTSGLLGQMFWAAERPSTRNPGTTFTTDGCRYGVGTGSTYFNIQFPMPALRQQ
jgi:hypothetical protein